MTSAASCGAAILLATVPCSILAAQTGRPPQTPLAAGEIRGRLVGPDSGMPMIGAFLTLLQLPAGTTAGASVTGSDGTFRIQGVAPGRYNVRARVLGFAPVARDDVTVTAARSTVDLGTLRMSRIAKQLDATVVSEERDAMQLAPDRNAYNVKNLPLAAGGSAVDVLRVIPSVDVDATNHVSLRGNANVVVHVNGRSLPLRGDQLASYLAQLSSSTIKSIEVATNPSAKSDPEGAAGIINIVLNDNVQRPLSGALSVGAGNNRQANASGNLGQQIGRFTWFASYGLINGRQGIDGTSDQTNLTLATPSLVNARIAGATSQFSQNGAARSELRLTDHDVLSTDAIFSHGHADASNASYFVDSDASGNIVGLFDQFRNGETSTSLVDVDVAYRHARDAKSRSITGEIDLTRSNTHGLADIFGGVHQGDASTGAVATAPEQDRTQTRLPRLSYQVDLTQPWGTRAKLEAGIKSLERHTANDFVARYPNAADTELTQLPIRSNAVDYREWISSGYALLSRSIGKLEAQGGARLEIADTRLEIPLAAADSQRFDKHYASVYPSAVLAYHFSPTRLVSGSYARRITRPSAFQLNPTEYRLDAHSSFVGNPALGPEHIDGYEFVAQDSYHWGTIQVIPYLRRTEQAVRFVQTTDSIGMTLGRYANVASTSQAGTDLNLTYRAGHLTVIEGSSVYRYSSNASNLPRNLSVATTVWSGRLTASFSATNALDLQAFGNYRSSYAIEGGRIDDLAQLNFAVRRKLWSDKGSVTLRVYDPFSLVNYRSLTASPSVVQTLQRRYGTRGVFVAVERSFGGSLRLRQHQVEQAPTGPPGTE
ncbi:MAG TPA: TonB-dependent receptor [Gemmatimonadaceae bacterium]